MDKQASLPTALENNIRPETAPIKTNPASSPAIGMDDLPTLPTSPGTPLTIDPSLPSDPELRKIFDDVLAEAKYAFTVVASGPGTGPAGGFGPSFAKYFNSRRPKSRDAYRAHAQTFLAAPSQFRETHFGRSARIPAAEYLTMQTNGVTKRVGIISEHQNITQLPKVVNGINTTRLLDLSKQKGLQHEIDVAMGAKYKTLQFFINSVHCFEETSGILEGSDEINVGGTIVDSIGNTTEIGEFVISDSFSQSYLSRRKAVRSFCA